MDDMYLDKMARYENMCNSWVQKANQEFLDNNYRHTKQECYYLQKAVTLRSEMARLSVGAEQDYQKRKAVELNTRIAEIVSILDPEYLKQKQQEARRKAEAQEHKREGSHPVREKAKETDSVEDEEVKSWFKEIPKHSLADVAGMTEQKLRLRNYMDPSRQEIRKYLGMRALQSYFFIGPPGCGKTYLIQAFAHDLMGKDYKFISLDGADILSRYVGDAEKTIRKLFEVIEESAPCIVFIDEIDSICKNRSLPNLPDYAASITTSFLTGYNRIKAQDKPVIFIGATNYPSRVDNAMLDRVGLINVPFPDKEGRILKFRMELKNARLQFADGFSCEKIGELTETDDEEKMLNYRDIERLCAEMEELITDEAVKMFPSDAKGAVKALENGEIGVSQQIFEEARKRCPASPKRSIIQELKEWQKQYEGSENK